jgi:hypothetical protein
VNQARVLRRQQAVKAPKQRACRFPLQGLDFEPPPAGSPCQQGEPRWDGLFEPPPAGSPCQQGEPRTFPHWVPLAKRGRTCPHWVPLAKRGRTCPHWVPLAKQGTNLPPLGSPREAGGTLRRGAILFRLPRCPPQPPQTTMPTTSRRRSSALSAAGSAQRPRPARATRRKGCPPTAHRRAQVSTPQAPSAPSAASSSGGSPSPLRRKPHSPTRWRGC